MAGLVSLWTKLAAVLAGGGVLAFGAGFFVGQVRGAYADGREAGRAEMALAQRDSAEEARSAAEAALTERDAETVRRIAAADARAGEAEKARNRALTLMRQSNADFDRCMAAPYPLELRVHLPPDGGLRDGV